jgi:pyruvate dehydrogenase E2 component (dihydrolipoamide acetyltransferase)
MAKILEMPKLSPTMEEGQLATWVKKEGDDVAIDDVLAEVETDKATMEFRSFDKGTLLKILAAAGTTVKLGQPVAILGEKGEDISKLVANSSSNSPTPTAAAPTPTAEGATPTPEASTPTSEASTPTPEASTPTPGGRGLPKESRDLPSEGQTPPGQARVLPNDAQASSGMVSRGAETKPPEATRRGSGAVKLPKDPDAPREIPSDERVKASPYVRKLAREQEIDLHGVEGTGPHGRIIARDLDAGGAATAKPKSPAPKKDGVLAAPVAKPLSMMRKTIARRLTESKQTVPHFYLTIDVDADALVTLREHVNGELSRRAKDKESAEKISLNDLIVKACAVALVRVPECNAQFAGDSILYHQRVDLSVAVAVPEGLLTPVVRDADQKSVREIGAEVRELAARAKAKKLAPEEMTNGTFSISNLGMFGIDEFSAVINPPEGAILAVGRVRDEPVVKDGAVVPGKRLAMTLSCDHRVIDGAIGARFLAELRALLENPLAILVD